MSFDPTIPQVNADLDAVPIRNNFNELKTLIDAIPAPKVLLAGRATLAGGETNVVLGFTPDPATLMVLCSYDFSQHALNNPGILSAGINFDGTQGWRITLLSTSGGDNSDVAWSLVAIG